MEHATEFGDLIKYENEISTLDFKATQYTKRQHEDLLKDVIAMANAHAEGTRHIILGVKYRPGGTRDFLGIAPDDFVDAATYQQLVRENVEPSLDIDYFSVDVDDSLYGVIAIRSPNRPYMMKKDFGSLRRGDAWIRKGSQQGPMLREDYDRIYEARLAHRGFEGTVQIGFAGSGYATEIVLAPVRAPDLPSARARAKIERILDKKRRELDDRLARSGGLPVLTSIRVPSFATYFGGVPYEKRSIQDLERDLASVEETYRQADLYELLETHAHRLNVEILNSGDEYIEDASIRLEFDAVEGLAVADRVPQEPQDRFLGIRYFVPTLIPYPIVTISDSGVVVEDQIGDVKHHMRTVALREDLRVDVTEEAVGATIAVRCTLFGRNLIETIRRELVLSVSGPSQQDTAEQGDGDDE